MHAAFNTAFADYPIPFTIGLPEFKRKFIERLRIQFAYSAGVWAAKEMVGFLFGVVNNYQGKLTAYNGGTGVVPAYRGQQLVHQMYQKLWPAYQALGVEQCVLEVLCQNARAVRSYEKSGFAIGQRFHCYKLNGALKNTPNPAGVVLQMVHHDQWPLYAQWWQAAPSFMDTVVRLKLYRPHLTLIEARAPQAQGGVEAETRGAIVFDARTGRISLLCVAPEHRHQGIGRALLRAAHRQRAGKSLSFLNLNSQHQDLHRWMLQSGFDNELDQYEMTCPI